MKKLIILTLAVVAAGIATAFSNPLPPFAVSEYSTSPPWIEMLCAGPEDLTGMIIHTRGGDAVIDSGWQPEPGLLLVLDSSNTSGFTLNPEGDSIVIEALYIAFGYGCYGFDGVPPLTGETAEWSVYHSQSFNFCATPSPGLWEESPQCNWGYTDVIISEISPHCIWTTSCGFVELYNRSNSPVNIGGWQVISNARYTIPSYTVIQPHKYFVLDEERFPSGFGPSPSCDDVYLLDNFSQVVDQTGWSTDHGENVAFTRLQEAWTDTLSFWGYVGYNDQTSYTFDNAFPSRRAFNRAESPGLKVIGIEAVASDNGHVILSWTNPIWLSIFAQAVVRRDTLTYPATPFDGELIYEGADQRFTDTGAYIGKMNYYTVFARTGCGEYSVPDSESQVSIHPFVGIDDEILPTVPLLLSCYPNPFNSKVVISYTIDCAGPASLAIYSVTGQKIAALVERSGDSGRHMAIWDATGSPSGVYFARLEADGHSRNVKLTLLK